MNKITNTIDDCIKLIDDDKFEQASLLAKDFIKTIEIKIGGIDKQYADWLEVWKELQNDPKTSKKLVKSKKPKRSKGSKGSKISKIKEIKDKEIDNTIHIEI